MKKLFLLKKFLKLSGILFFSAAVFSFVSCQNLLSGKKLRESLEEKIEYANAPVWKIKVYSSKGKISPNSTAEYKKADTILLTFTADSEYCFIRWSVKLGDIILPDDQISRYFKFGNLEEPDTTAEFIEYPVYDDLITIEPVCVVRPTILYGTPIFTESGTFRDSRIQVFFDSDMEEDSLYFTDEELEDLRYFHFDEYTNTEITEYMDHHKYLPDSGLLKCENKDKYYGYILHGEQFYKNIKVISVETGLSVLDKFGEPAFETQRLLNIPFYGGKEVLPAFEQLVVDISRNIYTSIDNHFVGMPSNERWSYKVNESKDAEPPSIQTAMSGIDYVGNRHAFERTTVVPVTQQAAEAVYVSDYKFNVSVKVSDSGSLPSSKAHVFFQRVKDEYYDDIEDTVHSLEFGLTKISYNISEAEDVVVDLSDEEKYPDGLYRVYIRAQDRNENSAYSYNYNESNVKTGSDNFYYLLLFRKGIAVKEFIAKGSKETGGKVSLSWSTPKHPLYSQIQYIYYDDDSKITGLRYPEQTSVDITNLKVGKEYTFKISVIDTFGNVKISELNSVNYTVPLLGLDKSKVSYSYTVKSAGVGDIGYMDYELTLRYDRPDINSFTGFVIQYDDFYDGIEKQVFKDTPADYITIDCKRNSFPTVILSKQLTVKLYLEENGNTYYSEPVTINVSTRYVGPNNTLVIHDLHDYDKTYSSGCTLNVDSPYLEIVEFSWEKATYETGQYLVELYYGSTLVESEIINTIPYVQFYSPFNHMGDYTFKLYSLDINNSKCSFPTEFKFTMKNAIQY